MKIRLISKKARFIENTFLSLIILVIFISCFKPFLWGPDEIGIKAKKLEIIDRKFYIRDNDPFGKKGYETFRGGPLYPKVLEGISLISIKLFNQSTTSILWNSITIFLSSVLSFFTLRLIYFSGKILDNESTGIFSMAIYTACPYSYLYSLSGGITVYVLFGTSLCTFLILKLIKNRHIKELKNKEIFIKTFLAISIIYLALLRPSSILFGLVINFILIIMEINNLRNKNNSKLILFFSFLILVIPICISIDQLWETKNYAIKAIEAFQAEKGTFMGYSRYMLREKIYDLNTSSNLFLNLKGNLYQILWKINDFFTGIIDIRDTHTPSIPLLPFLSRVSLGVFYLAPLTYIALLGTILLRKYLFYSGLWICLLATLISISPSLIGVAMSRYYFMFITPIILISSLTINKLFKVSENFSNK